MDADTNTDNYRVLNLPASKSDLADLRAGDEIRLYGSIYTMRDAGHVRALEQLKVTGKLPFCLEGQALFYAGPTEPTANRPFAAIGPTTASRMDFATPQLLEAGITVTLGKGKRSDAVRTACAKTGGVYLATTGGAAALLASYVSKSEIIAWDDLGTEALRKLELNGMPAFVAIDSLGNDIYREITDARDALADVEPNTGGVATALSQQAAFDAACATSQQEVFDAARATSQQEVFDAAPSSSRYDSVVSEKAGRQGIFVSFEGGEGTGKSTQILLLKTRLEAAGYHVINLREPGSTAIGEQIREILLNPQNVALDSLSELLLYEAARAQLVREVIRPALASGAVVLCDRFCDSTTAYQGFARGLGADFVAKLNAIGSDGLTPDRTIVLTRDIGEGLKVASKKGPDRIEAEGVDFHRQVHEAFERIAALEPERVFLVPLATDKTATANNVFSCLADVFPAAAVVSFDVTDELIKKLKEEN